MSDIAEERMQNAIDELEQENRLLRARNDRLEKEISELQENGCKFPLCQNEEYQRGLAEQIKRELYTGQPAQQQEPVADEVRCPKCGYLTKHTEHIGCLRKQLNAINAFEQRNFAIVNMDKFPQAQPAPMIRGDIREGLVGNQPTQKQIIAGAKALCNRVAETCNIDQSDQWKYYSEELIEDSRVVLTAAFNLKG